MTSKRTKPDLDSIKNQILGQLKDFQLATVEQIDALYEEGQKSVLVSDEVGLGKTMVAKGTIAMTAARLNESQFRVVYICSNAAIADQNLQKLNITNEEQSESMSTSRLSMQHLNIYNQKKESKSILLTPLTPDTSLRISKKAGTVQERALMFAVLRELPDLKRWWRPLEVLLKYKAVKGWGDSDSGHMKDYLDAVRDCNKDTDQDYGEYMIGELQKELSSVWKEKGRSYFDEIKNLCRDIKRSGYELANEDNARELIGQLRWIFAKISLEMLKPHLVIMDEFQRFKYLLESGSKSDQESKTEALMLADKFFNAKDVNILLLSATPYKLYSTLEEIDETDNDEHYSEFLSLMGFLNNDSAEFKDTWNSYSVKLKEMTAGEISIIEAKKEKQKAEDAMYQNVCRTERLSASDCTDIIDYSDVNQLLEVSGPDIRSYVEADQLIRQIDAGYHVPVDYTKSSPYLMSFMRDYKLKKNVEQYFKEHPDKIDIIRKNSFWLEKKSINTYRKIENNNARLEKVMEKVLAQGMENLLWMPPSRPYYEMQGVFQGTELMSKTLLFSSWEMVPRMLASMFSYEVERKTVGKLARKAKKRYIRKDRFPYAKLSFDCKYNKPKTMALFCLLYPSSFLSEAYDPIAQMDKNLDDIKSDVKEKIKAKLDEYPSQEDGNVDFRWYYIAPMLLDGEDYALNWIENRDKLKEYGDKKDSEKEKTSFAIHLDKLYETHDETISQGVMNLGKRPKDLEDILTLMAIASPAVCINRAYQSCWNNEEALPSYMPSQLARAFMNRMNSPESTAVIELSVPNTHGKNKRQDSSPYWQKLLTYCLHGNLQAVFDEYAHMICENNVQQMHQQMISALSLKTTTYPVDTYESFKSKVTNKGEAKEINMRTHFAVAFTKGDDDESAAARRKAVRNAFNSPFRPFMLASTSIGQEGLDFHNYCRRIVHWNLPSNPIDLEQREGRINRYECLAIRQTVARRYGSIPFKKDVWNEMFDEAKRQEKSSTESELIPYWGLSKSEDMVKIERIVPMYPLSRDVLAYDRLIDILSVYRLTLGQARQEELLNNLLKHMNVEDREQLRELFINLSPFYKKDCNDKE